MKIGCDIVNIKRFAGISPAFLQKYFTKEERGYLSCKKDKPETAAGMFAAKEAVFKTFQINAFPLLADIEILHENNIPCVKLHGEYKKYGSVEVSISHDGDYAIAYAVR